MMIFYRLKTSVLYLLAATLIVAFLSASAFGADVYITGITPVDDVSVAYRTSYEDAVAALPATTTITVSEGGPIEVALLWTIFDYFPMGRGPCAATGVFDLPAGVSQSDPQTPLEVNAIVTVLAGPLLTLADFDQPGFYASDSMNIDGVTRTYHYYLPSNYDPGKKYPVVLNLHGGGSYGLGQMYYSGFDIVAEREGFIVICPDYGFGVFGYFTLEQDLAFFAELIDHFAATYNIDTRRVYSAGISAGGGRSINLAYGLSDKIAAIASVSSSSSADLIVGQALPRPMTMIFTGGTEERHATPWRNNGARALEAAEWLLPELDCNPIPEMTYWPSTVDDPTSISRYQWSGGIFGTEVIVYYIEKGGHAWPGKYQYASVLAIGRTSMHIDGTEFIWQHFKDHTMPMQVAIDIKPKAVNLKSQGVITVAVEPASDFDTRNIEIETLRFGPGMASPVKYTFEGRNTLLLQFRTQETGIQQGDTSATLTGRSLTTGAFYGTDTFKTVPK